MNVPGDVPIAPVTFYVGGFREGTPQGGWVSFLVRMRHAYQILEGVCPICGAVLVPGDHGGGRCPDCVVEWQCRQWDEAGMRHTEVQVVEVILPSPEP